MSKAEHLGWNQGQLQAVIVPDIIQNGPSRVVIDEHGSAKSPDRALRMHSIEPDIIFIRDDYWSLGAPEQFEQVAFGLWKELWIAFMVKVPISGRWVCHLIHEYEDGMLSTVQDEQAKGCYHEARVLVEASKDNLKTWLRAPHRTFTVAVTELNKVLMDLQQARVELIKARTLKEVGKNDT